MTSSDIPAILGMDPFGRGPFAVWMEKVHPGDVKPREGDQLEIGNRLEPTIAKWCSELYEPLEKFNGTTSHPLNEWMLATPDYHNASACDSVPLEPWEIKAWTRDPGDYAEAQVRWQLAVLDAPRGHIAWWNRAGHKEPEHRIIERDMEAERIMIEKARDFWFGHVLTKKEPDTDASDECGRWFNKQRIKEEHLIVDAKHDIAKAVQAYRTSAIQVEAATETHTRNSNALKGLCRDLKKVSGPFGSFTYPFHKGKSSTNWEYIARLIATQHGMGEAALVQLIEQNTKVGEAYRQIHPNWSE